MNFKESILIFLRGLIMGLADIIPGVSGGTMALITGIYERLIKSISNINFLLVKPFFSGKFKLFFKNFKKIDWQLFVPLIIGIVVSFLAFAHLIDYLLLTQTGITYAFFFGLILSSAFFVYKQAGKINWKTILAGIIGLVFAFWFVGLNPLAENHSLIVLFFSGIIGICAMILPGISGSFILLLLGQYEVMINAVKEFKFDKLIVFIVGAFIGLLAFSKLLDFLLKRFKAVTMFFLTGLMLGSLRLPATEVISSNLNWIFAIISALIGFVIVFILERKFSK
jgi:putative membrane protein